MGYLIGLPPSSHQGARHILQWPPRFSRETARGSLGGGVYAYSEMAGHMEIFREPPTPFAGLGPGVGVRRAAGVFFLFRFLGE